MIYLEPFYTLNENGCIRDNSNSDGFRQSFEAEWQYACKAGTIGVRYGEIDEIRGGGWYDEERSCMATNRRRSHPHDFIIDDLGFRIARSII